MLFVACRNHRFFIPHGSSTIHVVATVTDVVLEETSNGTEQNKTKQNKCVVQEILNDENILNMIKLLGHQLR